MAQSRQVNRAVLVVVEAKRLCRQGQGGGRVRLGAVSCGSTWRRQVSIVARVVVEVKGIYSAGLGRARLPHQPQQHPAS